MRKLPSALQQCVVCFVAGQKEFSMSILYSRRTTRQFAIISTSPSIPAPTPYLFNPFVLSLFFVHVVCEAIFAGHYLAMLWPCYGLSWPVYGQFLATL